MICPNCSKEMLITYTDNELKLYHCCDLYMDFGVDQKIFIQYNFRSKKQAYSICAGFLEKRTVIYKYVDGFHVWEIELIIESFIMPEIIDDVPQFDALIERLLKLKAFS